MDRKDVPILCIDIERFTDRNHVVQRALLRRLQKISDDCGRFFSPHASPWSKWNRNGAGNGYYFAFDQLPPQVALKYAFGMARELESYNSNVADPAHRLRLRLALTYGDVEQVNNQVLSAAYGEAERFLSCRPVRDQLKKNKHASTVVAMSGTFRVMLDQHDARNHPDFVGLLNVKNWRPFKFKDKNKTSHEGFVQKV